MKCPRVIAAFLALSLALGATSAVSQDEDEFNQAMSELGWVTGPTTVNIANMATINLPTQYAYLDSADTAKLMELFQNPLSVDEYFVGPEDLRW